MALIEEIRTFLLGSLVGQTQNAVSRDVENLPPDQAPAGGADLGEEVVAEGEVLEVGQFADHLRNGAVEVVVGEVEELHLGQAAEGVGDRAGEGVLAGVEEDGVF